MFLSIIIFLLILGIIVFTHEFGHFIVAKKAGIKVEEFGIGFPPRIWGTKKGETVYSINAIPIGGFVKLYGEDAVDEKHLTDPRSFTAKPLWIKSLVIVAGVVMTFLLASLLFYFLLGINGFNSQQFLIFDYRFPFGKQENYPLILSVNADSPAAEVGMKPGTVVAEGNGINFESVEGFIQFIDGNKGKEISLKIRDMESQEMREVNIVPRTNYPEGQGSLGVGLGEIAELKYKTFFEKSAVGFLHSLNLAHYSIASFGYIIKVSLEQKTIEPLSQSVVGPVGILALTKITLEDGIIALLNLIALIAVALTMVNLFPLPALDGGRLLFLGIEALIHKKIPLKVEKNINLVGFVLLILLMVLISYKDIIQFKDILF